VTRSDWIGPPGATYRRLHEQGDAGWSIECSECGRVAGGIGTDSLHAIDALLGAQRHDRDCPEIDRARRAEARAARIAASAAHSPRDVPDRDP
jgi:hypothetical protein